MTTKQPTDIDSVEVSKEVMTEMRQWVAECQWRDVVDQDDADELTDKQVLRGVAKHYSGGIEQFLSDFEGVGVSR